MPTCQTPINLNYISPKQTRHKKLLNEQHQAKMRNIKQDGQIQSRTNFDSPR
ncbi:hypothetical protein QJS04_geneDACA005853 [Acorus gramineus]|uniref:Uncharacterized protein n=1 Tax=Acorus gramineus TaxID=55184 RepID=A0AAV9B4J0_ACOGR|nr:hypothetical protein QJS04_geneDACA005853 [Acorus gramineus]